MTRRQSQRNHIATPATVLVLLAAFALFAAPSAWAQQGEAGKGGGGQRQQGQGGARGGESAGGAGGMQGGHVPRALEEDDDSDRPEWAGGGGKPGTGQPEGAGTKKGDLFGDLWVLLRDDNGVPILNENGFVQPVDADGNPIPLDEEGNPIDESLVQEVELGRLNVGRSPSTVLEQSLAEALASLNSADSISVDAAGRLVLTIDGVEKTIDSPLENLALYQALMDTGTLAITTDLPKELENLADGKLTTADYDDAAAFFAAASDKTVAVSIDQVVYMNSILEIDGKLPDDYVDFSNFDYDRDEIFTGDVTYLRDNGDGTYTTVTESIMTAVFGDETFEGDGVDAFAQLADDARSVIEFVHANAVPE